MAAAAQLMVLLAVCGSVDAFTGQVSLRAAAVCGRAATGVMCSASPEGRGSVVLPSATLARRSFLAASLVSAIAMQRAAAEEEGVVEDGSPDEVVVEGEMRFEVGAEKRLQKVGGKGRAEIILRCVGKGVISKTEIMVSLEDFPTPGRPTADGESGGVSFVVAVSDLVAKTDKGRIVNRELWGDDDIFVAVDIYPIDSKKRILRGIGKAKYKEGVHQKPLVLLDGADWTF